MTHYRALLSQDTDAGRGLVFQRLILALMMGRFSRQPGFLQGGYN